MKILYTARKKFDKRNDRKSLSWKEYIKWSKLKHLNELVSLDYSLNEPLFEPDFDIEDWNYIHTYGEYITGFYHSIDYVLRKSNSKEKYNLLALAIEPEIDCKDYLVEGFDFMGYDLIDQSFDVSALSNCGGFEETFAATELNSRGLIDDFEKAYDIKKRLLENNPKEFHANTNVIAVWRHTKIGK